MINYYEILGLNSNAGPNEIKNAFRRLAKLYHPDKNPNGREHFNKILRAYEILSDPIQKSTYDYRIKYQTSTSVNYESKPGGTKTWRFDEKELKRRQYYNDYIKKQTEATNVDTAFEKKKGYNEYKYIFFATPLAVALFLLIVHMATPRHPLRPANSETAVMTGQKNTGLKLETGTAVYEGFFGPRKTDSVHGKNLSVKNNTAADVIVCLFSQKVFLRSFFVKENETFNVEDIPAASTDLQYCSGHQFDSGKTIKNKRTGGFFTDDMHCFKNIKPVQLDQTREVSLTKHTNGFEEISPEVFFKTE